MTADVKIDRESVECAIRWHYMDAKTVAGYGPWVTWDDYKRLLDAKEAAEAALKAQAEQVAVVKPLEWRASGAETTFGNYIVTCEEHDDRLIWFILFGGKVRYSLGEYVTEEAAKSAAQADYERRKLHDLTIRSANEVRAEGYAAGIEAAVDRLKMEEGTLITNRVVQAVKSSHTDDSLAALDRVRQEERKRCYNKIMSVTFQEHYDNGGRLHFDDLQEFFADVIMENGNE